MINKQRHCITWKFVQSLSLPRSRTKKIFARGIIGQNGRTFTHKNELPWRATQAWTLLKSAAIDQFRYIKIQPKTIDLSTRLWGINTEFVGFIPQSLVLRTIVLAWILIYRNWSIKEKRDEFGEVLRESGIPLKIWNPLKYGNLESRTWDPENTGYNAEPILSIIVFHWGRSGEKRPTRVLGARLHY